jgi:hypothetical protein
LPVEDFLFSAGWGFLFGAMAGYAIKKVTKVYGDLKSAIQELSKQTDRMKMEVQGRDCAEQTNYTNFE